MDTYVTAITHCMGMYLYNFRRLFDSGSEFSRGPVIHYTDGREIMFSFLVAVLYVTAGTSTATGKTWTWTLYSDIPILLSHIGVA